MTMRSSRHKAIHIDISNIKHDTTCCNILPGGLSITVVCDICKSKLDIHTKKSSQISKKERLKHASNKCKQYWISKWSCGECVTQGGLLKHTFTRRYLNIEQDPSSSTSPSIPVDPSAHTSTKSRFIVLSFVLALQR